MHFSTIYPTASIHDVWYIYTYYHNNQPNVRKYAIFHGRYGYLRYLFTIYLTICWLCQPPTPPIGFSQGTWSITKPRFIKIPESKTWSIHRGPAEKPEVALVSPMFFLTNLRKWNPFWEATGAVSRRPVGPGLTCKNQYVSWEDLQTVCRMTLPKNII